MDRLKNLVIGSAAAAYAETDSPLNSEYNWNDLSFGNDTVTCDRFFRAAAPAHEQTPNRINTNINNIQIIFEDTVDSENNSNYLNCSVDSRLHTSPIADDDDDSGKGASNCDSPTSKTTTTTAKTNLAVKPKPLRSFPVHRPTVPNVVLTGQLYEQRRKERMQQIERVEREQRQFHAKKVPNFNSIHAAQSAKRPADEPKFTIPVTPKVVHNHRKNLERIRAKLLEDEAARQPKPFVAKHPDVLTQPPFVLQQTRKLPTEPKPFHLHSEERVHERHQFDQVVKQAMELREREQEERRKAEDEQIRREIRKGITFKANPNPFA